MPTNFHQLMIAEQQARKALEVAVENFLESEQILIEENSILPDVTRLHAREAALTLFKLVVEKKIASLTATGSAESPDPSSPPPPDR